MPSMEGAWDYPLSRKEKEERVLLISDIEIDLAKRAAEEAEREKRALADKVQVLVEQLAEKVQALQGGGQIPGDLKRRSLAEEAQRGREPSAGSIAAVRWEGSESIQRLNFIRKDPESNHPCDTDAASPRYLDDEELPAPVIELALRPGEYVSALRGREPDSDPVYPEDE